MLKIFVLLFLLYGTVVSYKIKQNFAPQYCYATDKNPYKYFSTKTGYDSVHGTDDYNKVLEDCKPVQFWSLNRHGTRLPGKKSLKGMKNLTQLKNEIIQNYENQIPNSRINSLCEEDIELLKSWSWNNSITKDNAEFLTEQGWNELRNMAKRNYKKYPELLGLKYSEKDYLFRHTMKQRTQATFRAYAEGLFGSYKNIKPITLEKDTLIQTYKYCKLYKDTVDDNPDLYIEYTKFRNSNYYQQLISDVSERLGLKYLLNIETIDTIYDMCRYQQAWYPNKKSPWCLAFTEDQLKIIEYSEDLDYYYSIGYGLDMSPKVGCMPLQDMIKRFGNIVNGEKTEPKSVHYFTHSSALQLFMVSMGMIKDQIPLKADNWNKLLDRKWRTSLIGSFATNVNAVLYKCAKEEYKVEFYISEHKYYYPECPNGVCSWEIVKNKFSQLAENCNMDFCNNDKV